jgi:RHS repeat-associated protein
MFTRIVLGVPLSPPAAPELLSPLLNTSPLQTAEKEVQDTGMPGELGVSPSFKNPPKTGGYRGLIKTFSALSFGVCRNSQGNLDTDKLFTGQRLDQSGLYFYNARYYDATIGRFISPDTTVQNYKNPQSLNRYSYCLNNPLKYIDPTGYHWWNDAWKWFDDHILNPLVDYYTGLYDAVVSTVDSIGQMLTNPLGTLQGICNAVTHPEDTAKAMWNEIWTNSQSAEGVGKNVGTFALLFLGGAGISKVAGKLAALGDTLGATKALPGYWKPFAGIGGEGAGTAGESFFEGTSYAPNVIEKIGQNDFHSFPEAVKAFESSGQVTEYANGYRMLRIPGSYLSVSLTPTWYNGYFEFGKTAEGVITHRFFNPCGW